ncbi:MAG: hypothetical protein HKO13_04815 [Sphingomonas sp.]|nr:hypothetical protein [Sphingomonas sp.]
MKTFAYGALAVIAVIGLEFGPGLVAHANADVPKGAVVVEYADMGSVD